MLETMLTIVIVVALLVFQANLSSNVNPKVSLGLPVLTAFSCLVSTFIMFVITIDKPREVILTYTLGAFVITGLLPLLLMLIRFAVRKNLKKDGKTAVKKK